MIEVLTNLKHLHENPPNLKVSVSPEVFNSLRDSEKSNISHQKNGIESTDEIEIDWNISVDDSQIDWDVEIEQVEESADGFGSYEIISSTEGLENPEREKDLISDPESLNVNEETAGNGIPKSEICWDISLEESPAEVPEDAVQPKAFDLADATEMTGIEEGERSQLLDKEYRNRILDDLFEVF